ncbi:hypothetical protein [Ligilactobacillus saerimneri]|uniref:hypothetical protein n=1 Tax=Ligilactobacillus saerimneri TaxID=228229 RepID=UPI001C119390|nr:hypothetical protein [Ligilactobacillus saerimneri]MBU5308859.1 hypothetical protein [Ligilactobacillus saerimneri]
MQLTNDQIKLLKRYRGEHDLTYPKLADEIGIGYQPLKRGANGGNITPRHATAINNWLISQTLRGASNA